MAAAVLIVARDAPAVDLKVWPLFRYARDDAAGLLRWTAFGPLVEFTRTPDERDLRIRPLLWLRSRRGPTPDDSAEVLYPLAGTRWGPDYQSARVLFFSYRHESPADATPAAGDTSRLTLFPFVFYRRTPETGAHLSVLPFYLDQPDVLGYERVQALMFPAYLRLVEPRVERRFYLFPFVSTVGGADGRGFRLWPLFGSTEIAGRQRTRYVLWPFWIRDQRLVPGYGWETHQIDFPIRASIDGAGRTTHAYGMGAYIHTVDERRGSESTAAPWPFVFRERPLGETAYRVWRMAPFYGRSDRDGVSSRFVAWPAWRRRTQDVEGFHYERRDVGLLLWRRQTTASETSGHHERLLTLFPLLHDEDQDGRRHGQTPAIVDSLLPRNRGVEALWAPLYGLFRWDTRPDGTHDWNLLWGLLAREHGRLRGPWTWDGGSHGH